MPNKPHILLMGQTPPPWHGQAVATQILFDHDWPGFEVHRLRMEFSEEMVEVGRFHWKKIAHLLRLIQEARRLLREHPGCVLFYPPASANWIPFIRDVIFLTSVRHLAGSTVFIFHANGLPVFCEKDLLRRLLSRLAYCHADVALEVAQEALPPHTVFEAKSWQWCPCAIEVPERTREPRTQGSPMSVLFVGSLQEGKGVLEILRTASILKNRGKEDEFRFHLVGKWFSKEFEDAVRHIRDELEIVEMVELVGQLTGDAKWRAYFGADAFFFPTHYESEATPIVLMEALGAGLPVISTEWAGIPAMLEECPTARLLPIKSPEAYADALAELKIRIDEGYSPVGTSRDFYQDHFLPRRFIERVEKAFQSAIALQGDVDVPESIQESGDRNQGAGDERSEIGSQRSGGRTQDTEDCSGGMSPSLDTGDIAAASTVTERRYIAESDSSVSPSLPAPMATSGRAEPPRPTGSSPISISIYLADQNPGHDRSFGISRMSRMMLSTLLDMGNLDIETVVSKTSQQAPEGIPRQTILPWGTRGKMMRLLTDHFHPLFHNGDTPPDIHYFPKGYLPLLHTFCKPSVVTIHDTIIQYDEDHYPDWRKSWEYSYWAWLLKHTLRHADRILTVSQSSKRQILDFMNRHAIAAKEIHVTYEPCAYERIPQPVDPPKENHVVHLASCEPHKRTAHLVRCWHEAEQAGRPLPALHLIGNTPPEVTPLLASSRNIVKRPFLEDSSLQSAYQCARALMLPSEIEGFGLPALEAYYLGTPVCYVKGTSVEEILAPATNKGGFALEDPASLFTALDEVMAMDPEEVRQCGLILRENYASEKVAERMMAVFRSARE